jgi:cytidyltransferase-like protein|tara:strand:+ start:3093 stop:4397 length:1305 start_codon:yes stop_codon:yes gene_type:complete
MNNIKDINDFLTEKKVTVKRRYTESHPAKNVSTSARVRTSILEAIADGQITEAEMTRILKELKAHKRWLNRNKPLFNVSEDQGGIKTFSLSPYGKRVMNATKTTVINEALTVPHKEKGKKPVNIFVGRFQPFTLGHVKVFQKMHKENGYPVVVYMVRGSKPDPEKRPFDEDIQQAMFAKMKKQYPFLEASYVVPNGAIDTLYSAARPAYEPMMWGYGTDRKKAYNGMIDKQEYRDQLGVHPDFKGFEIKRGDENISASKVRNALKIDDEKTFKQMTPKSIHSFYKPLQTIMQPIKENNNMKNLKALNEFATIESVEINEKKAGFVAIYKVMGQEFKFGPLKTDDKKSIMAMLSSAIQGGFQLIRVIPADQVKESVNEEFIETIDGDGDVDAGLALIEEAWLTWGRGPMTEPSDIKPAKKELIAYCVKWLNKKIK